MARAWWLAEALRNAGLKVVETEGWKTRGGEMGDIEGVILHHTAGPKSGNMPSLRIITHGRPDLKGPLAQLALARDGTFYVVASGRSNHAGKGRWRHLTDGNNNLIGIEAENTGLNNDPWPWVQLNAYVKGVAAILKYLNLHAERAIGHKEWAPRRKIDPTFDMNKFRERVKAVMEGRPAWQPAPAAAPAAPLAPEPPPIVVPPPVWENWETKPQDVVFAPDEEDVHYEKELVERIKHLEELIASWDYNKEKDNGETKETT